MLDRLRDRVNRLFLDDEPEEVEEESTQRQTFQTKMMYQYPTKSSFRFPVIPDEEDRTRDPLDVPAYQRRKRERRQDTSINLNNEKETKKEQQRFVPTDVPSPIYGYQKRQRKKEIENVPAFVRKQQKSNVEKTTYQDIDEVNIQKTVKEEQIISHKSIQEEKSENKTRNTLDQVSKTNHSAQPIRQQNKQTEQSKNRRRRRNSLRHKQKNSQNSPVPFNVMMSANDKRHLQENNSGNQTKNQRQHEAVIEDRPQNEAFPSHLLNDPEVKTNEDVLWVEEQQRLLEETLKHFNVKAKVVNATQGPSVTRFEVQPELGVKVSRVRNLNDDIKLNMAAKDIRIEAPIPGKNTIGIEVPNLKPQMVGLQQILDTPAFQQSKSPLTIGLGLNVEGEPLVTNISKMPHGLIAGATGSGKSVCINTILIS